MTTTDKQSPAAVPDERPPVGVTDKQTPQPAPGTRVDERQARQVAEAARETGWSRPSFGKELFLGRLRLPLIAPMPAPDRDRTARGAPFLAAVEEYVRDHVDGA